MSTRIEYKGYIINSTPDKLSDGGFRAHGSIEIHYGSGVLDTPLTDSSSQTFNTEEEADNWFINKARTRIDNMNS